MTVALVTGIGGFTGRYVAEKLFEAGCDVHGLIRDAGQSVCADLGTMHVCNVLDQTRLSAIMTEIQPDYIVHLAGIAFVAHGDLDEMYRTNVLGTRTVLEASATASRSLKAVLVASSANVYGNTNEGILTEDMPVQPANDYAVTKVAVENLARIYSERLPVIVVRPFNYTGVGQSDAFLIPKIVTHFKTKAPRIRLGNLDVARDFSDVRAVTDAYVRLLQTPEAVGEIFNVCSGEAISLRTVLEYACEIAGYQIEITVNPDLIRVNEVKLLQGSREKLESVIGPLSMPPLEDTLRWMIGT